MKLIVLEAIESFIFYGFGILLWYFDIFWDIFVVIFTVKNVSVTSDVSQTKLEDK